MNLDGWFSGDGPFGGAVVVALLVAVTVEAGLLIPVLPADSLLLGSGYLTRHGGIAWPLWALYAVAPLAASLGQHGGYLMGRLGSASIGWESPRARRRSERIARATVFLRRYGAWIVLAAPLLPFIRTYVPVAAGAAGLRYAPFAVASLCGSIVWTVTILTAGAFLGDTSFFQPVIDEVTGGRT